MLNALPGELKRAGRTLEEFAEHMAFVWTFMFQVRCREFICVVSSLQMGTAVCRWGSLGPGSLLHLPWHGCNHALTQQRLQTPVPDFSACLFACRSWPQHHTQAAATSCWWTWGACAA
jgi:hypothetical protein